MKDDLDRYLDLLFGGLEGYVYSPVKRLGSDFDQKFFEWPSQREVIKDWINTSDRDSDAHVYISPAIYSQPSAKKSHIHTVQTAWIEFDGTDKVHFKDVPPPTAIVQSSFSTHLHCYWRIEPTTKEVVEDVNRRLTYYLDADTSGWDSTQLLRPPTTTNRKHNLPVVLASLDSSLHQLNHFDSAPSVKNEQLAPVEIGTLIDSKTLMKGRNLPTRIINMVKVDSPPVGARSSFMTKVAYELAEEGLNHLEIVSLLYHVDTRIKKFEGRSDQLLRLTQIAELALHKILVADSITVYTIEDIFKAKELEWICKPWLHKTGFMILSSAPNVGKTQLGLQFMYSLCLEENFLNMNIDKSSSNSILVMSLEMDPGGLRYILEMQKEEWSSFPKHFHFIAGEDGTLTQYENIIESLNPTVILIDSLTEMMDSVDADNDNAKARQIMKWIKKVRRRYECAVVLIHHNRKATEGNKKPKGLSDMAGSFEFGRVSETVVQMWEEADKTIELSEVKVRYGQKSAFHVSRNEHLWFTRCDSGRSTQPQNVYSQSRSNSVSRQSETEAGNNRSDQRSSEISLQSTGLGLDLDVGNESEPVQSNPTGNIKLNFRGG